MGDTGKGAGADNKILCLCTAITTFLEKPEYSDVILTDLVKNKTQHSSSGWEYVMRAVSGWSIFIHETWAVVSVSGRPCCYKESVT